jgi:hypothetical protein
MSDNLAYAPVTECQSKVALAAGTTTTVNTPGSPAGVTVYAIRSKLYSRAAGSNLATPTLDSTTGVAFAPISANQGAVVVLGFDAAGTNLRACQGPIQALDAAGSFIVAPQFPIIPDTICPVAYIVLKAGATAVGTFVFGTNNLSGVTGMVYAFQDICQIPDRVQVA